MNRLAMALYLAALLSVAGATGLYMLRFLRLLGAESKDLEKHRKGKP